MNIITTKLTDIKSNPNNPRIIKDDKFKKLVASIKEFPQMLSLRPIVVNDDMIVLGGNMRLKACKEAGLKEVPVIKASDLNEEQQKAFNQLVKDENLSADKTEKIIEDYLFAEREPLRDEVLELIEGNKPTVLERKKVGDRILSKILDFVDTFINGMTGKWEQK